MAKQTGNRRGQPRPKGGAIARLEESDDFSMIDAILRSHPQWNARDWPYAIHTAIVRGLRGPLPHELLTTPERTKVAGKISALANELANYLELIHGDEAWHREWPCEFQTMLDLFALECALDFRKKMGEGTEFADALADDGNGETFHAARYATLHLLMDGMVEALETLAGAAEFWKEHAGAPPLAKPFHKNAKRLYFIRTLTAAFLRLLGQPMRGVTLSITSIYFDCSDLSEADLSNLAPVRTLTRSKNY